MTQLCEGATVRIIDGPHKGLVGQLVKLDRKNELASVKVGSVTFHLHFKVVSR